VIMDDIPIIMYHWVNDRPAENPMGHLSISPREFEAHLHAWSRLGFEFITMAGLLETARAGRLGDSRQVLSWTPSARAPRSCSTSAVTETASASTR
jgi:hypothetical protein